MPSRISDPVENAPLQHALDALLVKLADRERTTTALARQSAELSGELQRRLAESESFNRVRTPRLTNSCGPSVRCIAASHRFIRPSRANG